SGKVLGLMGGHHGPVEALVFAADDSRLISGGEDAQIIVWDLESCQPLQRQSGHTRGVEVLALAGNSKLLASGGRDGSIRLWDQEAGKLLDAMTVDGPVQGLAFLPGERSLCAGTAEFHYLLNIDPGLRLAAANKFNGGCTSLAVMP